MYKLQQPTMFFAQIGLLSPVDQTTGSASKWEDETKTHSITQNKVIFELTQRDLETSEKKKLQAKASTS